MRFALSLIACLCISLSLFAQQPEQMLRTPFTPKLRKGRVSDFLNDIRRQTGYPISYSASVLDTTRKIFLPRQTSDLEAIFELVLSGQNVEAVESHGAILLIPRQLSGNTAGAYRVITGRLREKGSGEVLIGALVYDVDLRAGATTNSYGLYQLSVPEGVRTLSATSVGFQADTFRIPASGNYRYDVDLEVSSQISEIQVSGRDAAVSGERSQLFVRDIRPRPAALGEIDPMAELQLLPGVQAPFDGSSGMIVRGGTPGQNLHLLDGVPMYYVEHFFGLTSIYNSDALKSIDFYKSTFPARYGGRISSIVDAHGRDGDLQRISGQASVGLLKASANVGGPLLRDKVSVMVSGRRSWLDGLLRTIPSSPYLYFYDVNAKVQWIVNKNHRLYGGLFSGQDFIQTGDPNLRQRLRWNNTAGSLRWNAVLSPKVLVDAIATYNRLSFRQRERQTLTDSLGAVVQNEYSGTSDIREFSLAGHVQWTPGQRHRAVAGLRISRADFVPTTLERTLGGVPFITVGSGLSSQFQSTELSAYAENTLRFGDRWTVRPGVNVTAWLSGAFQYLSLQPRFNIGYRIRPDHSVFLSLSRMGQFLHLLSNNSFGFANDFWVPSTQRIRPEESWNVNVGWKKQFSKSLQLGVESYYRYLDGVLTYTTSQNIFDNSPYWQDKVAQGVGWAYGGELSARYQDGPWQAVGAYTLSWSWRRFEELNDGEPFPDRYDRRHNLNLRLTYAPSHRFDATAQWTYMTGEAFTIPDQLYADLDPNLSVNTPFANNSLAGAPYVYNYYQWNTFRLPDLHRLDLGVNFTRRRGLRYIRTWSLGLYNAYGRPNISFVNLAQRENGQLYMQGISLFRFVPYVGFKIQF